MSGIRASQRFDVMSKRLGSRLREHAQETFPPDAQKGLRRFAMREAADLRRLLRQVLGPDAELEPAHFDAVSDRDVLLRLENNVRLRLARREDWHGTARSRDRMLATFADT